MTQLVICQDHAYHRLLHLLEDQDGEWEKVKLHSRLQEVWLMARIAEQAMPGLAARIGLTDFDALREHGLTDEQAAKLKELVMNWPDGL